MDRVLDLVRPPGRVGSGTGAQAVTHHVWSFPDGPEFLVYWVGRVSKDLS